MSSVYKKWILSVFVLLVLISSIVFLTSHLNEAIEVTAPSYPTNAAEAINTSDVSSHPEELPTTKRKVDTSHYVQCARALDEYYSAYENWDRQVDYYLLLKQGYTLDAVSNALTHFHHDNLNFAILFRLEVMRENSEFNRNNELLNDEINKRVPELAEAHKQMGDALMSANPAIRSVSSKRELPVPLPVFEGLSSKTLEQKRKLLSSQQPRVDDLAYFIESDELSDEDIILMLEYLPNPSQIVGYTRVDSSSLLDYAAENARLKVVEALLKRGLMPTTDKYLRTSYEFALTGLDSFFDSERREDAVKIVRIFEGMGGSARLEIQSLDEVIGQYMRSDFRFTKEQISTLIIEHGLDLSVIPSRPLVKSDPEAPLVKELLKRKNDFIINKMVFSNIKETHDECIKTINEIDSKWKPKSASSFVWQFSQENDLNEIEMKAALAEIHPMLADRYPFHKASTRVITKRKLASHIDLLRYPKNRQYFFEKLTGKVLSDEERSVLFVAMLAGNAHSVHEVIKSDFFSSKKEYFWLSPVMTEEILEALEKTSLDMRSFDAHGKSLLFYQVNSRDTDLLDYLYENDYPFYPNSLGEDPLHKVLKQAYHKNYIHRSLAKIDALMRYEPKIDRFHLQYMALVKLKYIDTYHQIIEKHPGLTVNDDTPLPEFTELK